MTVFETAYGQCPICANGVLDDRQLIPDLWISKCLKCGLFINNSSNNQQAQSQFENINEYNYKSSIGEIRRSQAKRIIALAQKHDKLRTNWVDIGCSFGYTLDECKRAGYSIFGIEGDERACQAACRLLGQDSVHQGLLSKDILMNESVAIISILDVLEHIPVEQLDQFMQIIHSKTQAKGLLVVKVPSTEGLCFQSTQTLLSLIRILAPAIFKRIWQTEYKYPHTVYFNKKNLALFIEKAGFEILDCEYLEEVSRSNVMARLQIDTTLSRPLAFAIAPLFYLFSLIEKIRGKTDTIVMVARKAN